MRPNGEEMDGESGASIPACFFKFRQRNVVIEKAGWKPALRFRNFDPVRIVHLFSTEVRMAEACNLRRWAARLCWLKKGRERPKIPLNHQLYSPCEKDVQHRYTFLKTAIEIKS